MDDFLGYVTKTIDMFSSMKFKQKIRCLFEQGVIVLVLSFGLLILGSIFSEIYANIFSFLGERLYYPVYHFFKGIYLIFSILFVVVLEFHIFKIRYLDYYEIVNDKTEEEKLDDNNQDIQEDKKVEKIFLEKKQEKIIIRDPKHSEYKFINGILRCILFMIKGIMTFIALFFIISFIFLVVLFVLSFLVYKTGWLFVGLLCGFLGLIFSNYIILDILYNFIISNKIKKRKLSLLFLLSMIMVGLGIGFSLIGMSKFNYVDSIKKTEYYEVIEESMEMKDNLKFISWYGEINYEVSNDNDVKIIIEKSKTHIVTIDKYYNDDTNYVHLYPVQENMFLNVRNIIDDINNYKIINYGDMVITIKSKQENIDKIKKNSYGYN